MFGQTKFAVVSFIFSFLSVSFLNLTSKNYRILHKHLNVDLKICNFAYPVSLSLCSNHFCVHWKQLFVRLAGTVRQNVFSIFTNLFPISNLSGSLKNFVVHINIVCAFLCSINQLRRFDDCCTFFSNVDKCQDYHKVRTSYIH